ncbi:alpha/beta hydrolase [Neolewinella litorea]|uniref:Alpha/beta fold hydrolase n=1 Tax=Neolewinella litorea TaxID=2562452 RepID=A0A4S4NA73_9BACT|nr:alpha/beta fold hydrolase [Neolewinella litorea]THH34968.1 alpha/beta fold hydrolase [Neolewinella litorea]
MNWIKRIILFLLVAYAILCAGLYAFQESVIFRPRQLPADYEFGVGEEMTLHTPDGVPLNVLAFQKPGAEGAILFLHGNRGSNRRSLRQTEGLVDAAYDLYLFDYRGYGKSGGAIVSEEQLFADAQIVYDSLRARYAEENIIVVGYSLGTGMASYLAANNHPRHCVLAAPYASITAMKNLWLWMVPDFILKYPLNTRENVARANCPVTVLHGQQDELIPFAMAEEIKEAAPERVELIPLPSSGHRGVILDPLFTETVLRLIK